MGIIGEKRGVKVLKVKLEGGKGKMSNVFKMPMTHLKSGRVISAFAVIEEKDRDLLGSEDRWLVGPLEPIKGKCGQVEIDKTGQYLLLTDKVLIGGGK